MSNEGEIWEEIPNTKGMYIVSNITKISRTQIRQIVNNKSKEVKDEQNTLYS